MTRFVHTYRSPDVNEIRVRISSSRDWRGRPDVHLRSYIVSEPSGKLLEIQPSFSQRTQAS